MSDRNRRTYLRELGVVSLGAGVGGCSGSEGDGESPSGPTEAASGPSTPEKTSPTNNSGLDTSKEAELSIVETRVLHEVTGTDSLNNTASNYNVHGTDLGHTFTHKGDTYMVFGDTFGPNDTDWRSNVMARLTDDLPSSATFDTMITDSNGVAKELITDAQVEGDEMTVIPTYGVSDGSRMYLHYMAVVEFDPDFQVNHSGLAYSDDDGQTWTVDDATTWPSDSHFTNVSIVDYNGYYYFLGSHWRNDGVALARVSPGSILDIDSYEYWTGSEWKQGDESAAVLIVPPGVGELSVRWSSYHERWLMMHLEYPNIALRTAESLTGPWDDERVVATADEYPRLYAPYMVPDLHGPTVTFTMSRFFPFYNVLLMRTRLE